MRDIKQATLRIPCERRSYPTRLWEEITITILDVHDYGRAIPRGLVVFEGEIWLVCRGGYNSWWSLESKIKDIEKYQNGRNFTKWRNYLRRILRWPWKEEYTHEIKERANEDRD